LSQINPACPNALDQLHVAGLFRLQIRTGYNNPHDARAFRYLRQRCKQKWLLASSTKAQLDLSFRSIPSRSFCGSAAICVSAAA
jgi:hypothetical protein